jgi:hypothetical protein
MKATINGKIWMATSMMPPEAAGRIIGIIMMNISGSLTIRDIW